ncbi:modification methylase HgiDII [Rhodococcus sp. SGAir0479]|uniref:modification methylase HgiDII n=1 Tax=Rhodococcus sp. SGAir0479 TaxID=2567884 RepID=UPI0010CD01D0|nr:modification methylase HgiDII [Rhodococcus sp. SGAir0479]QCQ92531.1 modification methylase HgiDII [Rhodococcus sp. SGAir0479]
MTDRQLLSDVTAKIDAMIGRRTNGLQDEVPPGASAQDESRDGEHGQLGHDFRLATKYLTALDIGQPGLIDRDEFDRLIRDYQ